MSGVERKIRERVRCCACGKSLKSGKHVNVICLDRLAAWKYPCWGNILAMDKYPMNRAMAVLCDRCVSESQQSKYAVEWCNDLKIVKCHPVEGLQTLPRISEEDILEARARLYKSVI